MMKKIRIKPVSPTPRPIPMCIPVEPSSSCCGSVAPGVEVAVEDETIVGGTLSIGIGLSRPVR